VGGQIARRREQTDTESQNRLFGASRYRFTALSGRYPLNE
jgi:hypothetical protein